MWLSDNVENWKRDTTFLVAAWNELFDSFTPDTFQPRLHSVSSLIQELGDIGDRCLDAPRWWDHALKIREELAVASEEEWDILAALPEYRWNLGNLLQCKSAKEVVRHCALLKSRQREYDNTTLISARAAAAGLPKEKKSAHRAMRRLATLAIQNSKQHSDLKVPYDAVAQEPGAFVDSLVSAIQRQTQTYECAFSIVGEPGHVQTALRSVRFAFGKRAHLAKLPQPTNGSHLVVGTVDADSPRSAIAAGRHELSKATDLFNLYMNRDALRIDDVAYWRLGPRDSFTELSQSQQAFRRLKPRNHAGRDTIEGVELVSGRLERRVLSALELHSIAMGASEPRLKLINLWSALETLAGSCDGASVISRVTHLSVDLLVWRRVDKVVRYLAIAAGKIARVHQIKSFGSEFPKSKAPYRMDTWELMKALCAPPNSPPITQLLSFASHYPFLCFRMYAVWCDYHKPRTLRQKLLSSRRRIEWQLWRIYRARNLLVHEGTEVPHLGPLLDNLHYYTSLVIQRVITGMKVDPSWGVREAIEFWNARSRFIIDRLQHAPDELSASDFLPADSGPAVQLWRADKHPSA